MKLRSAQGIILVTLVCASAWAATVPEPRASGLISGTPEQLLSSCRGTMAEAKQAMEALKRTKKPAPANVLDTFDTIILRASDAAGRAGLAEQVLPAKEGRDAAQTCEQELSSYLTDVTLDRGVYDVLASVDGSKLKGPAKHFLDTTLRDFRRAGVDKDDAARARIKALNDELVKLGQQFEENIAADVRKVQFDVTSLNGLPDDLKKKYPADATGKVTLTTNNTDYFPFMKYSEDTEARRKFQFEYANRAYPKNDKVLLELFSKRYELAHLLGYKDYADFVTGDKMAGSSKAVSDFIDKINAAAMERSNLDYDELLAYKKKVDPSATQLNAWETSYLADKVLQANYSFDAKQMRPYLEYSRVKQGLLDLTAKMYGISYKRVNDAKVWHKDVEVYDVYSGTDRLGRIYFDLFPRDNKYKHYATFQLASGKRGMQLPEDVLVCNFPEPKDGQPALMEYGDVVTFFHEYGHLLHGIFRGRTDYSTADLEWDFIEAPSQMFEEWTREPQTLQTFARHYQTNEPIPADLVMRMRKSEQFGKGSGVRQQMLYAALSLHYHDRDPQNLDTTKLLVDLYPQFTRIPYVAGTHFQSAFDHLNSYSAMYYTYMWSLVIAKDMFSEFKKNGLANPETAARYRRAVLEQGGNKPAAELVRDFLGRDYSFQAYADWLNKGD
jgi:thimet oligopeptidase